MCAFLDVEPEAAVVQRAFMRARSARGSGDYKVTFTSSVERGSIGRGKRLPVQMIPPPLLGAVNEKLGALGYGAIDQSWNVAPVDGGERADGPDGWRAKLAGLLDGARPHTLAGECAIGSFALVAQDDERSRWVVDLAVGTVRQGDGEVDCVITGTAEDLVLLITGQVNVGVLRRVSRLARPRPTEELIVDRGEAGGRPPAVRWRGAGPFPAAVSRTRRIWLRRPDRLRVEVHLGNRLVRLGVLRGGRWWRWDAFRGTDSSEVVEEERRAWGVPPLLDPPLLEPLRLLLALRLTAAGRTVRAGREVLCAHARPRGPVEPAGTAVHEFEFDAQHGTILRHAVIEQAGPVSVTEAVLVSYEAEIESERFVFVAPDGGSGRSVDAAAAAQRAADRS